ncbi:uncharacterized protein I206_106495 [Kwoniella pini CBS 10737]|uniref:Protein CPL1-like domain-containing protein n=1 Tax=Kwoniella pini CBS 10737 TaxID=1296096 RepID=A0A1B9HUH4_9TREE|nr:uncharacterized protein I206_07300 [Kwoniella pini CBS 10737]OCF46913.1 hypothetical protein I206_07300 [Kwoniella pini CBS 10737]
MIVTTLIAAIMLARSIQAATYVGCLPSASIPSASTSESGVSLDECFTFCDSSTYAFYEAGSSQCTCGSSAGSSTNYVTSQDSSGACAADEVSTWLLHTAFSFSGCYTSTGSETTMRTTFPNSPEACFTACASYGGAAFSPMGGMYICQCAIDITGTDPRTCPSGAGEAGFYLYSQAIEPEPTAGNARRALRDRRKRAQMMKHQYCPAGLTACVVGSDQESFECVDVQSDLESCGGCMNGLYGSRTSNSSSTGTECSALPNVAMGGVTCTRGQCEISACKYGYTLVDNQCVRMF